MRDRETVEERQTQRQRDKDRETERQLKKDRKIIGDSKTEIQ